MSKTPFNYIALLKESNARQAPTNENSSKHSLAQFIKERSQLSEDIQSDITELFSYTHTSWADINTLLNKNGLNSIKLTEKGPDLSYLYDVLDELLSNRFFRRTTHNNISTLERALNKHFDPDHTYDTKVLQLINDYELQIATLETNSKTSQESAILQKTKEVTKSSSCERILENLEQMHKQREALPLLETFIEDLCEEMFPDTQKTNTFHCYMGLLTRVVPAIQEMKAALPKTSLGASQSAALKRLDTFKEIFYVTEEDDLLEAIEQAFLSIQELKLFVHFAKKKFALDNKKTQSEVLEVVKDKLRFL